ncbi:MAG: hypothetical protein EA378_02595 [Phycisphaerales bacterium]|nr:MAG: hypothetical protein EA378_02595 [Phycisphaerales bacterium]
MAHVEVQQETETARGWVYEVRISDVARDPSGRPDRATVTQTRHEVRLDWADHDHWSGGTISPSRVVEAVLACVLEHKAEAALPEGELPHKFDLATTRRWLPTIDDYIATRL